VYSLLIAFGAGALVFVAGAAAFGPFAGILPGLLVFVVAQFLLGRWSSTAIQRELASVEPLLRERKLDEAVALLRKVQQTWGRWQYLLDAQVEAQLGILDYLQMKLDEARPKLEAGGKGPFTWTAFGRNPLALSMLACIHWRQGRKDDAWKAFDQASEASSTDPTLYQVWATLLSRDGKRTEALQAVAKGLVAHPKHAALTELQGKLANDKRVDPRDFGQAWFQYFPEDLLKEQVMTGRRGPTPQGAPQRPPAPRYGARHAPRR
jgi:tetratricopeptide (TPR) repeat protein